MHQHTNFPHFHPEHHDMHHHDMHHHDLHHDIHHEKCHHDDPRVRESSKKTEIKDDFGHTRFIVALTDFDDLDTYQEHDDLRYVDKDFQVEVISFCYSEEPLILVQKNFERYNDAVRFYEQNIAKYSSLCKAETRHWQDIDLYAKDVGYRQAECCANCKFCEMKILHHSGRYKPETVFSCGNEDIFHQQYLFDPEFDKEHECDFRHDLHHKDHFHVHPTDHELHIFVPVHPEVKLNGICDHYEKADKDELRKRHCNY